MALEPLILAVETSSRTGSAAIAMGGKMLAETAFSAPLRHSMEIFPAIGVLLERFGFTNDQIEHIYISNGPGSFTGLRIATTFAKIMHLANAVKIVTLSTLDVIAANVVNGTAGVNQTGNITLNEIDNRESIERIAAILDAKRGQFFIAAYERNTCDKKQSAEGWIWKKVMSASLFLDKFDCKERPVWLLGDGLVYYQDKFKADGICFLGEEYWSPRAARVHLLGWQKALKEQFEEPMVLTPNYLRKPDVTIKSL
jgi:tRNA threonylcarbamoyladenosine biosynthesis protein TsaB